MDELIKFWEKPEARELVMIAGWHQWADAGSISSGLPAYLVKQTEARKIGEIGPDGFYLFQIPGTHHFMRPEVTLEDGYVKEMERRSNEFFFAESGGKGLVIFLGDEPHLNADRYANAFLDAAEALGVSRVTAVGGVYGAMPYDKERNVSCVYSLWDMKDEMNGYAARLSNYAGGSTIGTYIVDRAKERGIEMVVFYAFVPAYDFAEQMEVVQGIRIEHDHKAWYELMRRLNHMLDLRLDLSELEEQADALVHSMDEKIEALNLKAPQLKVKSYIARLAEEFTEQPFMPLDDLWIEELGDLLEGFEDRPD